MAQQFELLLTLVLGDLLAPFFLQVSHFFTFRLLKLIKLFQAGLPNVLQVFLTADYLAVTPISII